ncbi:MAG TPA: hypothetical protein VGQ76_07315 [Thermoanaerobaculia bacterium]|jgi:alpha-mannosidase|nr:hypothetical protein [Thermoanaerobaculia bacterium]
MNDAERALRLSLGITDNYTSALILEQSAHCDWDWLATFAQYYSPGGDSHQAVRDTLTQSIQYIAAGISGQPYVYAFCEVAYLQAFWNDTSVSQDLKDQLRAFAGKYFFFASGGITSADNLLSHPEAFIRNYLLGRQWLEQTLGATTRNGAVSNQMWIPDDFGHDSQLPALLMAMGFTGTGFWRIPAQTGVYNNNCDNGDGTDAAPATFLPEDVGLDFLWKAQDGSVVQAHWLSNSYCQGNTAFGSGTCNGNELCISTDSTTWQQQIQGLIDANTTTVMPTQYMFTPIDCDFTAPYNNGPSIFSQWNKQAGETTCVVQATFDDYMKLVALATSNLDGTSNLQVLTAHPSAGTFAKPYIPNPYYMGCYASKPYLKIVHYETVRTLLLAEMMQVLLSAIGESAAAAQALTDLATGWNQLAPSTHHDYITGTAPNGTVCSTGSTEDVYDEEQVSLLDEAQSTANGVQSLVLQTLAANAHASDARIMVFNSLGFQRWTVVDVPSLPPGGPFSSVTPDGHSFYAVQDDGNGGLLLAAEVPPLGYTTLQLSTQPPNILATVSAQPGAGNTVIMKNGWLTAVIGPAGILDLQSDQGTNCFPRGVPGNQLLLFVDGGSIYRFGNEIPCNTPSFYDSGDSFQMTSMSYETGDLRATTLVNGTLGGLPFQIRYDLQDRERSLRVSVTGSALHGHSVMSYFRFNGAAESLTYGTTAHWDTEEPRNYFDWTPQTPITFEPTHDFVAVNAANGYAGAIYHSATPAWGIYNDGVVGCILRNTPGNQNATCATDPGTYTITYAVEPPDLLKPPAEGAGEQSMFGQALNFNTPLVAVPVTGAGQLPPRLSLATPHDERVLITALKAGTLDPLQLIVRVYQPTNGTIENVIVRISSEIAAAYRDGSNLVAIAVNALEEPAPQNLHFTTAPSTLTLDLPFAITTVALGLPGR